VARYGSDDVIVSVTTASGTTALTVISNYVDTIGGIKLSALTQETHAFSDAWVENAAVGVNRVEPFTIAGFYDDAGTSGPHALFGNTSHIGVERRLEIDFGSSDVINIPFLIQSYSRMPTRGELTRYEVECLPSGAPATAS
jgi:hypothetical protein